MENSVLKCNGLSKTYNGLIALNNLNIELPKGKIIGLLGPNGSGKTTLIKLISGLLKPTAGEVLIYGIAPGIKTKSLVSYLPERTYLANWMKVSDILNLFEDFYDDFDKEKALKMLSSLDINENQKLKEMSKGTKEKVQLIMVMSRNAKLYLLDEPIGGVDPAARDYILKTIISNYNPDATVIISTHLISDIENVLDEFIFIKYGQITMYDSVDNAREREGKSIDTLFREVFKC